MAPQVIVNPPVTPPPTLRPRWSRTTLTLSKLIWSSRPATLFSGKCALGAKLHFGKVEQESRETLALWPKSSDDIFIAKRV